MKKSTLQNLFLIFTFSLIFFTGTTYSRIIQISATSSTTFSPSTVNATVGDTIQWNRTGGSHTTTCDGSEFTLRPSGAASWDAPLTSGSPIFKYVIRVAGTYRYKCEPHEDEMRGTINAVLSSIDPVTQIAETFMLSQNYPNPFNPETKIRFSIPNSSKVILSVFDAQGREVDQLINENLNEGVFEISWNAVSFPSGVYYYKIQVGEFAEIRKMLLVK